MYIAVIVIHGYGHVINLVHLSISNLQVQNGVTEIGKPILSFGLMILDVMGDACDLSRS